MTKWEYKFLVGSLNKVTPGMNALGLEGWEIGWVYMNPFNCAVIMKRVVQ